MHQSRGWFIDGLLAAAPTKGYSFAGPSAHGWCPFAPARAAAGNRRVAARIVAASGESLAETEAPDARSPVAAVAWGARAVVLAKPVGPSRAAAAPGARSPVAAVAWGARAVVLAKPVGPSR